MSLLANDLSSRKSLTTSFNPPKKREIMNVICGYLNDRNKKLPHCCRFGSRARTQCQGQMTSQQNLM